MDGSMPPPPPPPTPTPSTAVPAQAMGVEMAVEMVGLSAEEEEAVVKGKTDCVYFLASPFTCKKGSECEYRHSDMARLNPRDCRYWLNGNCLNPTCAYRHPPLDGLSEARVPTAMGYSIAPMMPVAHMLQVPYVLSKQSVPCKFFQQGICRNGDYCAFMHAPSFFPNKPAQPPVSTASSDTSTVKKVFGGVEKSMEVKELSDINAPTPVELPKPTRKLEIHLNKKVNTFDEKVLPPNSVVNRQHSEYKPTSIPPTSGNPFRVPNRMQRPIGIDDHRSMQYKGDGISREPSPGFDVLVDDELKGSDYYHDEDLYGGTRENVRRNECEKGDSGDYDSVEDIERDMYRDVRGYDRIQNRRALEQLIASSEIKPGGSAHLERRRYGRVDSPERVQRSDVRHRLSRHRRDNDLKSVIDHDFSREKHFEDRTEKSSRRDVHYLPSHDNSLSGRFRGRIKLPVRSSSLADRGELWLDREMDKGRDRGRLTSERLRLDREMDRGRDRGRLISERPQLYSYQGRPRDGIKGRLQEDLNNDSRNNRFPRRRRDEINDNKSEFLRPKSLAEVKGRRTAKSNEQQPLRKRKFQKLDSTEDLSFEGPMPLKEILKRKRGGGGGMPSGGSEHDQRERKERTSMTAGNVNFPSAFTKNVSDLPIQNLENELQADEEKMVVEGAGGLGDEPVEGEDYIFDEGDPDDEFSDEDDDEFARKLGVVPRK
ncbi:putative tobamovirus multiplication protein 3-like [Capsicum annuum]|nr:putative tobamovirus multiplication protein 3-like [Capsicum annuum]